MYAPIPERYRRDEIVDVEVLRKLLGEMALLDRYIEVL